MVRQASRLFMLAIVMLLGHASSALADKRVALLIGNSAYQSLGPLKTPANKVAAMKAAFEKAGFDKVTTALELGRDATIRTLGSFAADVQGADIAVAYYSGRGLDTNQTNFLVPVDSKLKSERDVEDEAVSLDRIMHSVDSAKRLKLIIWDASRDPPFNTNLLDWRP